jgi:hypothetical protein
MCCVGERAKYVMYAGACKVRLSLDGDLLLEGRTLWDRRDHAMVRFLFKGLTLSRRLRKCAGGLQKSCHDP